MEREAREKLSRSAHANRGCACACDSPFPFPYNACHAGNRKSGFNDNSASVKSCNNLSSCNAVVLVLHPTCTKNANHHCNQGFPLFFFLSLLMYFMKAFLIPLCIECTYYIICCSRIGQSFVYTCLDNAHECVCTIFIRVTLQQQLNFFEG